MKLYLLSTLVFFFLGLYFTFNREKAFKIFLSLIILLPIGGIFYQFFFRFTVGSYEFFYVGVAISFIITILNSKVVYKPLLSSFVVVLIALALFILSTDGTIYKLKDFKPFLLLMVITVIAAIVYRNDFSFNKRFFNRLLLLNGIKVILIFIAGKFFHLTQRINSDAYYSINEEFRFADIGTTFVIVYFIYKISYNIKFKAIDTLFILIPILVSGSRTIFISLIIIFFISQIIRRSIPIKVFYLVALPLIAFAILNMLGGRFSLLLDMNALQYFFQNRYSPFFLELKNYESIYEYIYGRGLGHPFFIPWFEYRENIDNYNVYIDNLYLTLYMKYGVFAVGVFYYLYYLLKKMTSNLVFARYIFMYMLIMSFTAAIFYQLNFAFIYIFALLLASENYNKKGIN